jgi:hypothetical protein
VTHVLLPVCLLVRRRDDVAVIGEALLRSVVGQGDGPIAWALERPVSTVRAWIRRFRSVAERVRVLFTVLLVELDPEPEVPEPMGSAAADAVAAVFAARGGVVRRFGAQVSLLSVWGLASAVTCGTLLAPAIKAAGINTNRLW